MLRLLDILLNRPKPPTPPARSMDYAGDREADRVGQLSAEDRVWEEASRQRNRDNDARGEATRSPRS
jgi:hypothetical protein